jgi:hypothetical protein
METSENMAIWARVCRPPEDALKKIIGGRLQGMTDINPQWRLKVMTEVFGPCGVGWKWDVVRLWTESGPSGEVMAFAHVNVWAMDLETHAWAEPIPGIGGSALVAKERDGLRANDEAFKMAITDALSVALKCLGVASDIYERKWDGSKYKDNAPPPALERPARLSERPPGADHAPPPLTLTGGTFEEEYGRLINPKELRSLMGLLDKRSVSTDALRTFVADRWGIKSRKELRVRMLPVIGAWVAAEGKEVA